MSDDSPGSFRSTSRFCGKSGYPFGSNVHELALECSTFSIAPIPATCKTISTATVSASSSTHLAAPFTQSSFWSFRYEDGDELGDFDPLDCGPDSTARDRTDKRGPSHRGRSGGKADSTGRPAPDSTPRLHRDPSLCCLHPTPSSADVGPHNPHPAPSERIRAT